MKKIINNTLVMLAGIFLVFEEWLWKVCYPTMLRLATHPRMAKIEALIVKQKGYDALSVFLLPVVVLIPFKFAALFVFAHGHIFLGGLVFILAKFVCAALTARIYHLTYPALMSIDRFVYWQGRFFDFQAKIHARLHEIPAWGRFLENLEKWKLNFHTWTAEKQMHPMVKRFMAAIRWKRSNTTPTE